MPKLTERAIRYGHTDGFLLLTLFFWYQQGRWETQQRQIEQVGPQP